MMSASVSSLVAQVSKAQSNMVTQFNKVLKVNASAKKRRRTRVNFSDIFNSEKKDMDSYESKRMSIQINQTMIRKNIKQS